MTGSCFTALTAPPRDCHDQSVEAIPWQRLDARFPTQSRALRQALILEGVDFNGARALVGTCHSDDIVADTLDGFRQAVRRVKQAGLT